MPVKTAIELPLVLKDRIILSEGRWNGVFYPADELEPLVQGLNNIPRLIKEAERRQDELEALRLRNATSLFWDHDEKCQNWLGDVKNFRWDKKEKAIRGDLYLLDEDAARKLQYQGRREFSSWGVSPSVLVDRIRMTARNIKFLNIGVVLDPAGGVNLMLSKPRVRGEKPMAKKNLSEAKKNEEKEEENKEGTEEETKVETSAEETTASDSTEESTEDLGEIEIDNEEGSEGEETEEEMAATLNDVMNAVKALAKMFGDLIAGLKKAKVYGYPYKKTQEKELSGLADLGKDKLTAIAGSIGKAYKKLEGENLELANLCGFITEVNGLLPVIEELEADDEKEEKTEEKKETTEAAETKEEKAEEKTEASEEKKEEGETSKENMSKKLVEDLRAGIKQDVRAIVSEEIARRVRPRRKSVVEDQVEKLAKERQDLRKKLRDPSTPLQERFDLAARIACGEK